MSEQKFSFSLVSPEKILMSEDVKMVTVPGTEGEFGLLPDHAPILSSLQDGLVVIETAEGEEERIFVAGGFADMNDNICTILAEDAVNIKDIDVKSLEADKEVVEEKLNMLADGEELDAERSQLKRQLHIIEQKLSLAA